MSTATDFSKKVIQMIKKIPLEKVATYGQIAKLAGKPQGSRGVAWILNSSSEAHKLPWHRVINAQGKISFPPDSKHYRKQKSLLTKEGVEFRESDSVDFKVYQWKTKLVKTKTEKNKPRMFS